MNDIYFRALRYFGTERQLRKCAEECLELALAITHHLDDKRQTDLVGEVADVRIMLRQVSIALGEDKIQRAEDMKLDRLEGRIIPKQ